MLKKLLFLFAGRQDRLGGLSDQTGSPAVMAIIEDILGRVKK
jgi:hypothetical protein